MLKQHLVRVAHESSLYTAAEHQRQTLAGDLCVSVDVNSHTELSGENE